MNKSDIKKLLSNMCCSECKKDFDEESIVILRNEKDLIVIQIVCSNCGKSFGIAFLGTAGVKGDENKPLEFQTCPKPIDYDDVIEAHNFIDKLEKDWSKYIPDELKNK